MSLLLVGVQAAQGVTACPWDSWQVWLAPDTGYANAFLEQLQRLSTDSTVVMLAIFAVFALVHSGLAYLRPYGAHLAVPIPMILHQPHAMHPPVLDPCGTHQVPHFVTR